MSLLKLSPESDRLRRLARAHAAGELPTADYRRMRADVIEAFGTARGADLGDVTERRGGGSENTVPRASGSSGTSVASPLPSRRARWHWVALAGFLGLLLALAVAAGAAPPARPDTTVLSRG
jgi:hypothetical protein